MALLREKVLKSTTYKIVLWTVLISMVGGTAIVSLFVRENPQRTQARPIVVNGSPISQQEFEFRFAQEMERISYISHVYNIPADMVRNVVSHTLINEKLLDRVAQQLGITLPITYSIQKMNDPMSIMSQLRGLIPLQVISRDGHIDHGLLNRFIRYRGMSTQQFEQAIEMALCRALITDIASLAVVIDANEVRELFERLFLKHTFTLYKVAYDAKRAAYEKELPSDDTLRAFFTEENNKNKRFWTPEKRTVTTYTCNGDRFGITITDDQIAAYYAKHKKDEFIQTPLQVSYRTILIPVTDATGTQAAKQVRELYKQIQKEPHTFEALAKQHSKDTKSAAQGGLVGFVARGTVSPEIESALFKLKNDGDIAPIIQTERGLEIIQRVAKRLATYKPLDTVKKQIHATLLKQEFAKQFTDEASAAIARGTQEIAAFVKEKGATPATHTISAGTDLLAQKVFKTKKEGWTKLIDEQGRGVIVQVTEIHKSAEPAFDTVKETVKKAWAAARAQEAIREAQEKGVALAKKQQLNALKTELQAIVAYEGAFAYTDTAAIEALNKKGIPASQLLPQQGKTGAVQAAIAPNQDLYIAVITHTEPFNEALWKQKEPEIKKDLYNSKKEIVQRAFIANLYEHATIQRNN
ncbi:MAG: peptidylprolyl isomerase [Candidatus Babeliales bacterium]